VQVIESDAPQMQFSHVSPYTQDVHVDDLSTFRGARHPAGVIFCMRQEQEAAAFIASQDRRLSLAIKDARGVVAVLGSYERAFRLALMDRLALFDRSSATRAMLGRVPCGQSRLAFGLRQRSH
jgi:hypothetical protein